VTPVDNMMHTDNSILHWTSRNPNKFIGEVTVGGLHYIVESSIRSNNFMLIDKEYMENQDNLIDIYRYRDDYFRTVGHYYNEDQVCIFKRPS